MDTYLLSMSCCTSREIPPSLFSQILVVIPRGRLPLGWGALGGTRAGAAVAVPTCTHEQNSQKQRRVVCKQVDIVLNSQNHLKSHVFGRVSNKTQNEKVCRCNPLWGPRNYTQVSINIVSLAKCSKTADFDMCRMCNNCTTLE